MSPRPAPAATRRELRRLSPADAARALSGSRVADAAGLAGMGCVYAWAGMPIVAAAWRHPLDDALEIHVFYAPSPVTRDLAATRGLVGALRTLWPGADHVLFRIPEADRPDVLAGGVLEERAAYLVKTGRGAALDAPADARVAVRPAGPDDGPFVRDLLARALVEGLAAAGRSASLGRAREYAHRTFCAAGGVSTIVALVDGERAGHATWRSTMVDDVTGEPYCQLVDVSVAAAFRDAGVGRALASAVEATVSARVPLVGHVAVGPGAEHERLLARLALAAWSRTFSLCGRALRRRPARPAAFASAAGERPRGGYAA